VVEYGGTPPWAMRTYVSRCFSDPAKLHHPGQSSPRRQFLEFRGQVQDCQFVGNAGYAMAMRVDSFARLKHNTAIGNGQNVIASMTRAGASGTWVKDNLPYTLLNYVGINSDATFDHRTGRLGAIRESERIDARRWRTHRRGPPRRYRFVLPPPNR